MWRRHCLILVMGTVLAEQVWASPEAAEVNLDYVAGRAAERARHPFHSPRAELPKILRNLDYDQYREIRFRRDKALWTADNLPFRIEFFHPGYIYQEPIHVYEFTSTHVQPIRFVQDFFDYDNLHIQNQIPANTGYAGFRVLYALNQSNQLDELGAFLGASYFRLLGRGQTYGPSGRGLALDCGESDRPEEFPIFTDWWLGKPQPGDKQLVLLALLDSVRCTGAYEFFITPGDTTVVDVEAVLYFREPSVVEEDKTHYLPPETIGLAPLTSMFWFGENSERKFDDYRTGVHDSDGLLMHMSNDEVVWRPLNNPTTLRHQIFHAPDIKGFGLLQRERSFSSYEDSFNLEQDVPSIWIEPHGHWGDGDLHLVELNADWEGLDNIVAFWDPRQKPEPLQRYHFGYTMFWTRDAQMNMSTDVSSNCVVATRVGLDSRFADTRQFVLDFAGPKLSALPTNGPPPAAIANCSTNAAIVDNFVQYNPFLNTWRLVLKMQPKPGNTEPVDMRCTLQKGTNILSETWTYQWSPP